MSTDLFIGNLDRALTTADLEGLFSQCGRIQRANVVTDKVTGQSKGFGFVAFATPEEANEAISRLDGYEWNARPIKVSHARPKEAAPRHSPAGPGSSFPAAVPGVKELFVKGLSFECTNDDLQDMFAPYGGVIKAKVITDRETRRSKGFGFVQMSSTAENQAAIQALDGMSSGDRILSISEARERPNANAGGFRQNFRGHTGASRNRY
jgi:nucleolin